MLLQPKLCLNPNTVKVGDFTTTLLPVGRSSRQKLSGEMMGLNYIEQTDIYIAFYPNTKK